MAESFSLTMVLITLITASFLLDNPVFILSITSEPFCKNSPSFSPIEVTKLTIIVIIKFNSSLFISEIPDHIFFTISIPFAKNSGKFSTILTINSAISVTKPAINSGALSVSPCKRLMTKSLPFSIKVGKWVIIVFINLPITSAIADNMAGAFSTNPKTKFVIICPPASNSCGAAIINASNKLFIISPAPIINSGIDSMKPVTRLLIISTPDWRNNGNWVCKKLIRFAISSLKLFTILGIAVKIPFPKDDISSTPCPINCGAKVLKNADIASGNDLNTSIIIGIRLPNKNVITVSAKLLIASVTVNPSSSTPANEPSIFLAAAFIAVKEPLTVSAASSAVVPVIPTSFWIAWIAS